MCSDLRVGSTHKAILPFNTALHLTFKLHVFASSPHSSDCPHRLSIKVIEKHNFCTNSVLGQFHKVNIYFLLVEKEPLKRGKEDDQYIIIFFSRFACMHFLIREGFMRWRLCVFFSQENCTLTETCVRKGSESVHTIHRSRWRSGYVIG